MSLTFLVSEGLISLKIKLLSLLKLLLLWMHILNSSKIFIK
jgi:hypothetical protein